MSGYDLRKKDAPPLEVRSTEEYLARLKELEPWAEKVRDQMRRQVIVTQKLLDFRFTV